MSESAAKLKRIIKLGKGIKDQHLRYGGSKAEKGQT
jgi:hypothetical protein